MSLHIVRHIESSQIRFQQKQCCDGEGGPSINKYLCEFLMASKFNHRINEKFLIITELYRMLSKEVHLCALKAWEIQPRASYNKEQWIKSV